MNPDPVTEARRRNDRLEALLRAALDLSAEHDLDQVLERIVRRAAELAGARYAALSIYDQSGRISRFLHHGVDAETVRRIGHEPEGRGLLAEVIAAKGPLRLDDVTVDPRACGFPPHHPVMHSFLGVPIRSGSRRLGSLYLAEKTGGDHFDDEDERLIVTLAAFAAAAVEGAQFVAAERQRATAEAALAVAQERSRADREILAQVIGAQEAERARVARDLHDEIGQSLTSVLLGLRLVTDALDDDVLDPADARAHAQEVRRLVGDALEQVRKLAFDLRPTVLDDVGLVAAVRRLVADLSGRHGIPVEVELEGVDDGSRLPAVVETVVYRVVQEALTNVARHADASRAAVLLVADASRLRAFVTDDGIGFHVPAGRPSSLGLAGMTERAALVGGHVEITSQPGAGTSVTLEVPLA